MKPILTLTLMLISGLFSLSCGADLDDPGSVVPEEGRLVIEFEAVVDTSAGTIEVVEAVGRTSRGVVAVNVVQDGMPGTGPADSVELVTESTGFDGDCGFASSF